MKQIEIYCKRLFLPTKVYIYWAYTIQDAIDLFKEQHPEEKVTFAHDTKFTKITNKFNPHLKQFKHESEIQS